MTTQGDPDAVQASGKLQRQEGAPSSRLAQAIDRSPADSWHLRDAGSLFSYKAGIAFPHSRLTVTGGVSLR